MAESAILKYGSGTPGNDSNTYNIYNSVAAWNGARMATQLGYKRLVVDIKCDQTGTLNWYKSVDRGTNWTQIGTEASITAPASTSTLVRDFLIEEYDDFKLDWVNGGTIQGVFVISVALTDSRNPAV